MIDKLKKIFEGLEYYHSLMVMLNSNCKQFPLLSENKVISGKKLIIDTKQVNDLYTALLVELHDVIGFSEDYREAFHSNMDKMTVADVFLDMEARGDGSLEFSINNKKVVFTIK